MTEMLPSLLVLTEKGKVSYFLSLSVTVTWMCSGWKTGIHGLSCKSPQLMNWAWSQYILNSTICCGLVNL